MIVKHANLKFEHNFTSTWNTTEQLFFGIEMARQSTLYTLKCPVSLLFMHSALGKVITIALQKVSLQLNKVHTCRYLQQGDSEL